MNIVVLCATDRGYQFLKLLIQLAPNSKFTVFSFKETSHEPPFLDKIRKLSAEKECRFIETKIGRGKQWQEFWETAETDIMFVVSWRYLISPDIYSKPKLGTFVIHDSLLPIYRGFSPTPWAIINGEKQTGATLFEICDELDAGDIIAQKSIEIHQEDYISGVMERITQCYLDLLKENLSDLLHGKGKRIPQDHSLATFTCKRLPADNEIHWNWNTLRIHNLIRGVSKPYPGAFSFLNGKQIIIWSASLLDNPPNFIGSVPGRVVEFSKSGFAKVLTGDGVIQLNEIQIEGGEIVPAAAILNKLSQKLGHLPC